MSHWIRLEQDGKICQVPLHSEGGTIVLGGTSDADMNVTYNYGKHFGKIFPQGEGLSYLNGRRANDCIPLLTRGIEVLGTKRDEDYWNPTEGNAGHTLLVLLKWAQTYPDAIFYVD